MENMEVLVREMVMQSTSNTGLALGMSFQGLAEWAWVAIVATILIAFVSAKRVSIVSVGWTWGAKPGQVRVRVHSFSSLRDGSIVATSGMFSAEILNCSADSCSEDASSHSSSDHHHLGGISSETSPISSKVAAEVMFIFEKKRPMLLTPPQQHQQNRSSRALPFETTQRKRAKSRNHYIEFASLPSPKSHSKTTPKPVGFIEHDSSLTLTTAPLLLPSWAHSLLTPPPHHIIYPCPSSTPTRSSQPCVQSYCATPSPYYDPLWKLRIHDTVICTLAHDAYRFRAIAPVFLEGSSVVTTVKGNFVRVWESGTRALRRSLCLPKGAGYGGDYGSGDGGVVSAFDVDWEVGRGIVAVGRRGGVVGVGSFEVEVLEGGWYQDAAMVECVSLDRSSLGMTVFAGGPATLNPGCSVSLWDSRSSTCQLSFPLTPSPCIYGIRAQAHELYVRDKSSSVAAHDVRMLGAPSLHRLACPEASSASTPEDRWWDMETSTLHDVDTENDVEDEFWDCPIVEEAKLGARGGSGYVGSFVMAIGRNFSTKSPSKQT